MLHNMRSVEDSVYAHSLNVSLISRRLGRWLKFSPEELDTLTLAGALHDIGKLKIPAEVLNKPGKYTDEEFALVKQHPKFGYDILKSLPLDSHVKKQFSAITREVTAVVIQPVYLNPILMNMRQLFPSQTYTMP